MAELIPAINADDFEEVKRRVRLVEPFSQKFGIKYIHIDVADGTFTKNTIWHDPKDLVGFETIFDLEVHLMIADIDRRIDDWLFEPARRVIFHLEAARDPELAIQKCVAQGKEVGLALNPETSWIKTRPYWDMINLIQILGVTPGLAGQKMQSEIADKIRALRRACAECIIEVDGGVTAENAKGLVDAGANYIVAASAIFGAFDIKEAISNLKSKIQ